MARLDEGFADFEDWAAPILATQQVPGAIVALAKDGALIYTHGFGYSDVEQRLPIREETIFGIGSVTKSFTALALMQLVEAGKLSLSDPVNRYLPKFRTVNLAYSQATTLHHLLTHTAGLPMYNSEVLVATETMNEKELAALQPLIAQYGTIRDVDALMEFIANNKFTAVGAPGEHISYSNDGYALLGSIIERVTDMPYPDYIKQHILDPVGMTRTVLLPEALRALDDVATLYAMEPEAEGKRAVASPNWWYSSVHYPAGIFTNSCVRDMIRYLEIFRLGGTVEGAHIVTEQSIQHILSPHTRILNEEFYGYGMSIHPNFHGQTLYEHGGGAKGVSSQVCILPEAGLTAVALSNVGGAPSAKILYGALHAVQGRTPGSSLHHSAGGQDAGADTELGKYVGAYQNGDSVAKVELMDGKLMLAALGLQAELTPTTTGFVSITHEGTDLTAQFFFGGHDSQPAAGFNMSLRHFARVSSG